MTAWAVVACDQFTSEGDYWRELEKFVGKKPSALNLVYPEIYLKENQSARIAAINAAMQKYLRDGIFEETEGMILVRRTTEKSGTRTGIMLAIDLEDYSFKGGVCSPVRSTEATILERIPPRVAIRRDAPIELPHIMLLYDDPQGKVLKAVESGRELYSFALNMGGGYLRGNLINNPEEVTAAFYSLIKDGLLFAVGDGNHSLAAAKTCWENLKPALTQSESLCHPARFALCEAVNIFDPALEFEPIFRLVKTDREGQFMQGLEFSGGNAAYAVTAAGKTPLAFADDVPQGIRELDEYISGFIKRYGGEVDYIHGEKNLEELVKNGGVGVIMPAVEKSDFFDYIVKYGALPRKTFSMGEGCEKRYYLEAKRIK